MKATVGSAGVDGRAASRLEAGGEVAAPTMELYGTLLDHSSDLVVALNPDGTVRYANRAAQEVISWIAAKCGDESALIGIHPDDQALVSRMVKALLHNPGSQPPVVVRVADQAGNLRAYEVVGTNHLHHPRDAGVIINAHEVTETQRAREALAESEALLREAQRISSIGHWSWDLESGDVQWLADEMFHMHGVERQAWAGTIDAYLQLVPADDHAAIHAAIQEGLTTGHAAVDHRIVRPDETVRWLRTRGEFITRNGSSEVQVLGTCQDITEHETLRQALGERVKELTCLVAIGNAAHRAESLAELCEVTVESLTRAMQEPGATRVQVEVDGVIHGEAELALENAVDAPVVVSGCARGHVRCSQDGRDLTFLPEERELVAAVATTLGLWIERHESQAALRDSEERFRRLFDNAPDIIYRYRTAPTFGFDYVSPSVTAITGFTPEEHLADGRIVESTIHPDDVATFDALVLSAESSTQLLRMMRRDGAVCWTEHRVVPVYDDRGQLIAVEGVARDVSDRVAATEEAAQRAVEQSALARLGEAALAAASTEEFLNTAVSVVAQTCRSDAVGLYEVIKEGESLRLSAGVGWGPGQVGEVHVPADDNTIVGAALQASGPVSADLTAADPDGPATDEAPLHVVAVAVKGRDTPFGVLVAYGAPEAHGSASAATFLSTAAHVVGETVARARAEAALSRSEREFRSLAEHSPDITARFDRQRRHLYVSPSVEAATGLPTDVFIGKTNAEMMRHPSELVEIWDRALDDVIASGQARTVEFSYPTPAGVRVFEARHIPEFDEYGVVQTVLAVTRDITAIRRAEEQRREVLTRIVEAQEKERARIAEDIHDDSIQVMVAAGFRLEVVKRQLTDESAIAAVDRLAETVHRAIDRLRSLMFDLRPAELDREGLVAALQRYLEIAVPDDGPAWSVSPSGEDRLAPDLRAVLYRVGQEAITNAIKHARATSLAVAVDDVDEGVQLRIADDGIGFASDDLYSAGPHHLGATSMVERVSAVGGRLDIITSVGGGTVVTAWVPYRPQGASL